MSPLTDRLLRPRTHRNKMLPPPDATLADTITWAVWFDLTNCPLAWALGRVAGQLWAR